MLFPWHQIRPVDKLTFAILCDETSLSWKDLLSKSEPGLPACWLQPKFSTALYNRACIEHHNGGDAKSSKTRANNQQGCCLCKASSQQLALLQGVSNITAINAVRLHGIVLTSRHIHSKCTVQDQFFSSLPTNVSCDSCRSTFG